jgi:hypothetical protein
MLRIIAGIIVGFIVAFAGVMATFGITIVAMGGLEGVLQPNSWWTTDTFNIIILLGGFIGAIAAGWVCNLIARNFKAAFALAAIMLAVRVGNLVTNMNRPDPPARTVAPTFDRMFEHGKEPMWFAVGVTVTGALGVLIGASLVRKRTPA